MIKLSRPNISKEAIEDVCKVLESGMLVQGEKVLEFENELKKFIKVEYVSAVSSGTAALHLALQALEISENDAVIVPDFTFVATANVVELQKARTVLVDVEPTTYNMCPEKLEEAIINYSFEEKLKAIIVVHEFGAPANMTKIMEIAKKYNLFVIEDAACALGAYHNNQHVGTFGDIGCFSFHPRKSITTGEGGVITTNSKEIKDKIDILKNHGIVKLDNGKMDFILPGFNYRMTEFQAVLGNNQLRQLDSWLTKRQELVDIYYEQLKDFNLIRLPKRIEGHAWQTFMVKINNVLNRDKIIEKMKEMSIETNLGAQAVHAQSYYNNKYKHNKGDYTNAETLYNYGLALPLHQNLTAENIEEVCRKLKVVIENHD